MHPYKIECQFTLILRFVALWFRGVFSLNSLFFFSALSIAFPMIVTAATPDEDWITRSTAPGVVAAWGFNNTTTDIVEDVNLWSDGGGTMRGGLDTSVKASGNGSLRFDIPPPPHSGADIAGRWMPQVGRGPLAFGDSKFSLGDTFYLQYRTRMDKNYIDNSTTGSWTRQWKNIIMHEDSASCSTIELTTIRKNTDNLVWAIYDSCGRGIATGLNDLDFKLWNGDESLQNSDFHCVYDGSYAEPDCFLFTANEWMTFYWKVQISSGWEVPDGKIEVWVSTESHPAYRKLIEVNKWPTPGEGTRGYNNVTLTTYMTALPTTDGLPGITSHLWYDELIVSTQPINAPGSSVPLPPKNLTIQ